MRSWILGLLLGAVVGVALGVTVVWNGGQTSAASLETAQRAFTQTIAPVSSAVLTAPVARAALAPAAADSAVAARSNGHEAEAVERRRLSVPELVQSVRPAVVHVATEAIGMDASGRSVPGGGVGTGFVMDVQGRIVTNNHVVAGAQRIVVTLPDGRTFDATVIGRDPQTDLAVIRIEASDLKPVRLGRSGQLRVGESVVAIGHALDLPGGPTVTTGVVSALDRTITNVGSQRMTLSGLIQTDASINPGNSGGPLLNLYGEVVGINSAGAGGGQGIGFAISIDGAKPVLDALIAEGRVVRGFLGIVPATITRSIARQADLPVDQGVFIVQVSPGSAAAQAGLRRGDILLTIAAEPVPDAGALSTVLAAHKPGSQVVVTFMRPESSGDRTLRATVTLGERPVQ